MSEPKDPFFSDALLGDPLPCDPLATLSEKLLPLDLAEPDGLREARPRQRDQRRGGE